MTINTWFTQLLFRLSNVFTRKSTYKNNDKLTEQTPRLSQERKMAAREVKYLNSFTHWPTAIARESIRSNKNLFFDIKKIKISHFASKESTENKQIINLQPETIILKRKA